MSRQKTDSTIAGECRLVIIKDQLKSLRGLIQRIRAGEGNSTYTIYFYGELIVEYARLLGEFEKCLPNPIVKGGV